jgi:hypothetical protein
MLRQAAAEPIKVARANDVVGVKIVVENGHPRGGGHLLSVQVCDEA